MKLRRNITCSSQQVLRCFKLSLSSSQLYYLGSCSLFFDFIRLFSDSCSGSTLINATCPAANRQRWHSPAVLPPSKVVWTTGPIFGLLTSCLFVWLLVSHLVSRRDFNLIPDYWCEVTVRNDHKTDIDWTTKTWWCHCVINPTIVQKLLMMSHSGEKQTISLCVSLSFCMRIYSCYMVADRLWLENRCHVSLGSHLSS